MSTRALWAVPASIALIGIYYMGICFIQKESCRQAEISDIQGILASSLRSGLDSNPMVLSGLASIVDVGSGDKPRSVFLVRKDEGYEDYSYCAEEAPVVPGGIMQAATLTYSLEQGVVYPERLTPTCQSILPELAKSCDYRSFLDDFDEYFGVSETCYLPQYTYQGPVRSGVLSISDGSGVILTQEQILRFYGILANGGVRPACRYYPKKRLFSENVVAEMVSLLRQDHSEGTGLMSNDSPVPVAGKTGSGILDKGWLPGYGRIEEKGDVRVSSFAGFFPADNPRYVLCVTSYYKDGAEHQAPARSAGDIVNGIKNEGLL